MVTATCESQAGWDAPLPAVDPPAPFLVMGLMAADLYLVTQTPPLVPAAGSAARPGADIAPATLLANVLLHVH